MFRILPKLFFLSLFLAVSVHANTPVADRIGSSRPIRVSFFAVRAGEGHVQIARAVLEHLKDQKYATRFEVLTHPIPGKKSAIESQTLDYVLINHYFTDLQRRIWGSYTAIGTQAPVLWGPLFAGVARLPESILRNGLRGYLGQALSEELNRGDPDVIVCTMPILARIVNLMKRRKNYVPC